MQTRPLAWTIAAAGPGLADDIRIFDAFGVRAAWAVSAVVDGVGGGPAPRMLPLGADALGAQLSALSANPPHAIRTGLLDSVAQVEVVARCVSALRHRLGGGRPALVVETVLPHGAGALELAALGAAYRDRLLPLATLAVPGLACARALAPQAVASSPAALAAAWRAFGVACVAIIDDAALPHAATVDWLDCAVAHGPFRSARIESPSGTGAAGAHAAAATAALARGLAPADAVVFARMATQDALRRAAEAGDDLLAPRPGFALQQANLPAFGLRAQEAPRVPFAPLALAEPALYAICDSAASVARAVQAGVRIVQIRLKELPAHALVRELREAIACARRGNAQLIVNDHWELAIEFGADGVHLGPDDIATAGDAALDALRQAGLRLGVSALAAWEVCRAWALRPSYIACGPVHGTPGDPRAPLGESNLAYWCRVLRGLPVVAVGGMDAVRARAAVRAGAAAVAAMGAISRARDPQAAIARLQRALVPGRRAVPFAVPDLPVPDAADTADAEVSGTSSACAPAPS